MQILLDLGSDANYKQNRFIIILLKKDFKFIPNKKNGTIVFDLSLEL